MRAAGKLSLVNRLRASQLVLQSPRLPGASGRRHSRVISAFIPQKRSRPRQAHALGRAEVYFAGLEVGEAFDAAREELQLFVTTEPPSTKAQGIPPPELQGGS